MQLLLIFIEQFNVDDFRNSMSSQEVVDFVNERRDSKSLKEIGAEVHFKLSLPFHSFHNLFSCVITVVHLILPVSLVL